ncbi:hypothetical protein N2152v2_000669 [Parachlorella kessleri]
MTDGDALLAPFRGHGTQAVDERLVATTCGIIERVNKLVSVRTLRNRYGAEVGDVVVGRVTEVAGKRWRVDLGSRGEASLLLSAVNLPGGVQRRRTAEDELSMRSIFQEGDVISAEVQSLHHDGTIQLHTRSLKYGRLQRGQLVRVPPNLIKRQKQHFQHLEAAGVDVVLGCNGAVWVGPHVERPVVEFGQEVDPGHMQLPPPTPQEREKTSRVAQAIIALAQLYFAIHPTAISALYQLSLTEGVAIKDMCSPGFLAAAAAQEAQQRMDMEVDQ